MAIKVRAPGSCGELVQGTINGRNFLITCPVNLYSEAEVGPNGQMELELGEKTRLAVQKTLEYLNTRVAARVKMSGELPVGKGMASSSADISAACQAVAISVGRELAPDEIADIALSIEPTDGIFYPGIVMFDHVRGTIRQYLGFPPRMKIAVFDVGGEVDTRKFNGRPDLHRLNRAKEEKVREAVELVTRGLATGNCELIGRGAIISARANQDILYKPCLEEIVAISGKYSAVGVNVAHSGTVIGILFPPDKAQIVGECVADVQSACPGVQYLKTVDLISGGLTVLSR